MKPRQRDTEEWQGVMLYWAAPQVGNVKMSVRNRKLLNTVICDLQPRQPSRPLKYVVHFYFLFSAANWRRQAFPIYIRLSRLERLSWCRSWWHRRWKQSCNSLSLAIASTCNSYFRIQWPLAFNATSKHVSCLPQSITNCSAFSLYTQSLLETRTTQR